MPAEPARTGPEPGTEAGERAGSLGTRLLERAADAARRFVLLFLYLWVMFGLFALHERILLKEHGIGVSSQGIALFNAFVFAKVMLLAEDLNFAERLRRRPLIYPILHQSVAFAVLFIGVHLAERTAVGLLKGQAVAIVPNIGEGGILGLACVAVILAVGLMPYFAFRNFTREIGAERMKTLLFGTGRPAEAAQIR